MSRVALWLLLLTKAGQHMTFDAEELGIKLKTLLHYVELISLNGPVRYKAVKLGGSLVGVRRLRAEGQ